MPALHSYSLLSCLPHFLSPHVCNAHQVELSFLPSELDFLYSGPLQLSFPSALAQLNITAFIIVTLLLEGFLSSEDPILTYCPGRCVCVCVFLFSTICSRPYVLAGSSQEHEQDPGPSLREPPHPALHILNIRINYTVNTYNRF